MGNGERPVNRGIERDGHRVKLEGGGADLHREGFRGSDLPKKFQNCVPLFLAPRGLSVPADTNFFWGCGSEAKP
jgi:hypothetical protein